ncbi:MAG: ArdC-like ssDNA-binding domain-containing protein [Albidovulum sp.]
MGHLRRQLETRLAAVLPAEDARPTRPDRPVAAMAAPAAMGAPARRRKTHRGRAGAGAHRDLYQEVTDRIVAMIEAGTAPWQRPWDRARHPGAPAFPVNAATGKTYRGVNVLLLGADPRTADDPRWCGYEQAKARGWQVRAGARGATIYFFKRLEIPDAGEADAEPPPDEDGRPLCRTVPLLRRHTVFHASQIEGIPSLEEAYGPAGALPAHVWEAEDRLERILRRGGARIVHGGDRAYYDPVEDFIALPPRERFPDAAAYFGVAFHELGHWTGHETRLNRPFSFDARARRSTPARSCGRSWPAPSSARSSASGTIWSGTRPTSTAISACCGTTTAKSSGRRGTPRPSPI